MATTTAMDDVGRISRAGDSDGAGPSVQLPASATTTFAQLPLRAELQRALRQMRFHAPSPIQLRALPLALFGTDVIGQAKSGTGKTAVFGLTAVEHVLQRGVAQAPAGLVPSDPLALILAPTREIAMQIDAVLRQLAAESESVRIVPLIGGLPVAQDQKRLRAGCHIAVGTPGRVRWLMEDGVFRPKSIRLLVFDEVDKLLSGEFVEDIDAIVAAIPPRRQTLAFSATFTPDQLVHVVRMMRDPQVVRVRGPGDVTVELVPSQEEQLTTWIEREKQHEPELWLRHVRQFYRVVPQANDRATAGGDPLQLKQKLVLLASLLSEIAFHQCIVFCNDKFRAEALATALASQGWPAAAITGAQPQTTRNAVMDQFRAVALRVLVSTDLTARGIDVDRVNFVVNLDLPRDPATYLHRVGRTGRFGGKIRGPHGLAVTLLTENEVEGVRLLRRVFKMAVDELPTPAPRDVRRYVVVGSGDDNTKLGEQSVAAATPTDETEVEETADTTDDHAVTMDDDVEEAHRRAEVGSAGSEVEEGGSDGLASQKEEEARSTSSETFSVAARADDASTSRRYGADDGASAAPSSEPTRRQHASVGAVVAVSWEEQCYTQWLRLL